MMQLRTSSKWKRHLYWFPFHGPFLMCFFVLNGMNYFKGLVSPAYILSTVVIMILLYLLLLFLVVRWLKDLQKSGLFLTLLFFAYLFFGVLHDALRLSFLNAISQYRFFLPLFLITTSVLCIKTIKSNGRFLRATFCLNIIFITLALYEFGKLMFAGNLAPDPFVHIHDFTYDSKLAKQATQKPDIYFLLFDAYLNSEGLKRQFGYNSDLDTYLASNGFHNFRNTRSHYMVTSFSMTSVLNLNLLNPESFPTSSGNKSTYPACLTLIENNRITGIFRDEGYAIYNCSLFDLKDKKSRLEQPFLPTGEELFFGKTLFHNLKQNIAWTETCVKYRLKLLYSYLVYDVNKYNKGARQLLSDALQSQPNRPKFVYAHFLMPHGPFYFDSLGRRVPTDELLSGSRALGYSIYTSRVIEQLINEIQSKTQSKAVIILASDHGYGINDSTRNEFNRQNLFALYFPDMDYKMLNESLPIVNCFRIVLNKYFNQKIPFIQ